MDNLIYIIHNGDLYPHNVQDYPSGGKTMKRIPLILLVLFYFLVPKAQAETIGETLERFELFTGCAPIGLSVRELPSDAKKINLTEKAIKNSVESRLRSGRIFNNELLPYSLDVGVNIVGYSFSINLGFYKPVRDVKFPELFGIAVSWERGLTGTHGEDANFILSSLSKMIDEFLVEYFRVNEKACNKTR